MEELASDAPAHFGVARSGLDSEPKAAAVTRIAAACRISVAAASRNGA